MSNLSSNIEFKSKENSIKENSEPNLIELIKQCKLGERKAQYSFYKKTFNFMYAIAIRYEKDHDEALFIINEAFYKVLTNIEKFDLAKNIYSWIKVILINLSNEEQTILDGDRIAQLVVQKVEQVQWELVQELNETDRSAGGFGHTGKS